MQDKTLKSVIEDLEALSSQRYLAQILKARLTKKAYSSSQVKKRLGLS